MIENVNVQYKARLITALHSASYLLCQCQYGNTKDAKEEENLFSVKRKKNKTWLYPKSVKTFKTRSVNTRNIFWLCCTLKYHNTIPACQMCAVSPPCSLLPQVLSKIAHKSTHFLCLKTTQCQAHTFPIKACRDKTGNTHLLSNKRNEPENTRLKGKHPKRWNLVSLRKWVFCFLSTARQLTFTALIKVDWLWNNAQPIFFLCRLHECKCECKLDSLSIYGMYVSVAYFKMCVCVWAHVFYCLCENWQVWSSVP